ncbi:hypothetical protein ANCCAN_03997 [Ancylostoma caninum]|uniref:MADF domain-containing protein n=1 Tax=Ancylostoma caninum TaxID=29170 RepID=A0A368H018_ANCCA|nr:hypothetical protein ANCCAN_03997 [Ancylostoma caninum]
MFYSLSGLNFNIGEVKKAWKGLRDHWRRLNNKKTGSSAEGPWVFSKNLRFLESGEVTGNRICNFQETCLSQDVLEDEENAPPLDSPSPEENSVSPARRTLASTTPLSKRKRTGSVLDEERGMIRDATAAVISRLNENAAQPQDKYAIFAKFVEKFLRDLPEDAAKRKMFVINNALFQDDVTVL